MFGARILVFPYQTCLSEIMPSYWLYGDDTRDDVDICVRSRPKCKKKTYNATKAILPTVRDGEEPELLEEALQSRVF